MKGILLSAYVENITTRKDKSVKLTMGTQELSQGKAGEVFAMLNDLVTMYLSPKEIDQREIDQVDKIDPEISSKSQSQRIRNVLFILFTQGSEGHKDFDSYYRNKTELIIEDLKTKIQQ